MKLELPDDNASVLFHMGNALQCIARDIDATLPVNGHKTTVGDVSHSVTVEPLVTPPEAEFTEQQAIEHIADGENTDAEGLPWDRRIHVSGVNEKTRTSKNTWRMARKPKNKTDEEWAEYVEDVKAELSELMAIPVAVTYDPNEADPVEAEVVTPPVVDAVVTPPAVEPVVTPPAVEPVVPPPSTSGEPAIEVTPPVTVAGPVTFPELMRFITMNNSKLTKDVVDVTLKAQGLASIALLAARPDLIPQVHAALSELL